MNYHIKYITYQLGPIGHEIVNMTNLHTQAETDEEAKQKARGLFVTDDIFQLEIYREGTQIFYYDNIPKMKKVARKTKPI